MQYNRKSTNTVSTNCSASMHDYEDCNLTENPFNSIMTDLIRLTVFHPCREKMHGRGIQYSGILIIKLRDLMHSCTSCSLSPVDVASMHVVDMFSLVAM